MQSFSQVFERPEFHVFPVSHTRAQNHEMLTIWLSGLDRANANQNSAKLVHLSIATYLYTQMHVLHVCPRFVRTNRNERIQTHVQVNSNANRHTRNMWTRLDRSRCMNGVLIDSPVCLNVLEYRVLNISVLFPKSETFYWTMSDVNHKGWSELALALKTCDCIINIHQEINKRFMKC